MSKPIIAIVGRPNVGKSMLFNKIIGRRLSIVEDTPGVTRDRIYGESDWQGRKFTLIDTGGIEPRTDNQILAFMRSQAQIAIDNATVIVFLCDIKTGMTASDQEVASMLQRCGKPVILAVNKVDQGRSPDIYEFYNLGLGDPIAVSAVHGHGTGDLLASATVGGLMRGLPLEQALQLAVDFTLRAIELTCSDSQATWYGVEFERAIPWLTRRLEELGK